MVTIPARKTAGASQRPGGRSTDVATRATRMMTPVVRNGDDRGRGSQIPGLIHGIHNDGVLPTVKIKAVPTSLKLDLESELHHPVAAKRRGIRHDGACDRAGWLNHPVLVYDVERERRRIDPRERVGCGSSDRYGHELAVRRPERVWGHRIKVDDVCCTVQSNQN